MNYKLLNYGPEMILQAEFGKLDFQKLQTQLKKYSVEIVGIIPLEKGIELKKIIIENLKINLDEDIIYPEDLGGIIYEYKDQLNFGNYRYLVILKEVFPGSNEVFFWYHAYENLENLVLEFKLLEEKRRCL